MAAAISQGMNLEIYFRKKFSIDDSVDILALMEAAITVAACKHPHELAQRRSILIKTLLHIGVEDDEEENSDLEDEINKSKTSTTQKKTTTCSRSSEIDDQKRQQQRQVVKNIPERKSSNNNIGETEEKKSINKVSSTATKNKEEEEKKKAMELKLKASKRKLHESYDRVQAGRDEKRIKVLEDVAPTTQESSCQKTDQTRRHKSVHKRILSVLQTKARKTSWKPV